MTSQQDIRFTVHNRAPLARDDEASDDILSIWYDSTRIRDSQNENARRHARSMLNSLDSLFYMIYIPYLRK